MNEFWYGLSDFFKATFEILPALGNLPNWLFIVVGFVATAYWVGEMRKHNKADQA